MKENIDKFVKLKKEYDESLWDILHIVNYINSTLLDNRVVVLNVGDFPNKTFPVNIDDVIVSIVEEHLKFVWEDEEYYETTEYECIIPFKAIVDPAEFIRKAMEADEKRKLAEEAKILNEKIEKKKKARERKLKQLNKLAVEFPDKIKELAKNGTQELK